MEKGEFQIGGAGPVSSTATTHIPDPEFLPAGRGEGAGDGRAPRFKTVATIVKDDQDRFHDKCPMK